jgi:hypothetical protein
LADGLAACGPGNFNAAGKAKQNPGHGRGGLNFFTAPVFLKIPAKNFFNRIFQAIAYNGLQIFAPARAPAFEFAKKYLHYLGALYYIAYMFAVY